MITNSLSPLLEVIHMTNYGFSSRSHMLIMWWLASILPQGYNQLSDLALMTKADINDSIKGEANQKKVLHAISVLREECECISSFMITLSPVKVIMNRHSWLYQNYVPSAHWAFPVI